MTNNKIKVLVADDSAFMRMVLKDMINSDPELEVIATAKNGEEAYQLALTLQPDVMTLDIEMPVMDGLKTLKKIMQTNPLPIIMLSALTQTGTSATIEALEKGAVDCIAKPDGGISLKIEDVRNEIINKIKIAAKIIFKERAESQTLIKNKLALIQKNKLYNNYEKVNNVLVAIATSTGGPKALHELMSSLPNNINASFLIVQHMPPGFTNSLAQRLNSISSMHVKEAEYGDEVKTGYAYVAPGNYHMEVGFINNRLSIILKQTPSVNGHRPSADVLMNSIAKINCPKIGIIMTGMGSDGAVGMVALKKAGSINIGENEESCVVYGMPKAAYKLGVIDFEVPLNQIAEYLVQVLKKY